tara:strand:- start:3 stop:674 length:672 start_codon:yes stop_codon:yes gene_type:complete
MISIVIPVLNEEEILKENFERLETLKKVAEIVFVDGGSSDATIEVASKLGRVLKGKKGRALQMNLGAGEANEDILLFLHADSYIDEDSLIAASRCIKNGALGGCFTQRLKNDRAIYRFIEGIGNSRAKRRKIFYGDQGIFTKKDVFFSLGGFPEQAVMEDVLFSKRLKEKGRVEILDSPIYVSSRRWERDGFFKTNFLYMIMSLLFYLRLPAPFIKRIYRDVR